MMRDHMRLLNQSKCVQDQFSWFKSLGGLLCSTTVVSVVCKRIVFIMNASKEFNSKYSLVRLVTFVLFQNRLLLNNDSAGSRIKEEVMCVNSCLVAPLRSYEARSFLVGCYLFFFIDEVSPFFVYTDDCGLCCKSSTESIRIIIFRRNIEIKNPLC